MVRSLEGAISDACKQTLAEDLAAMNTLVASAEGCYSTIEGMFSGRKKGKKVVHFVREKKITRLMDESDRCLGEVDYQIRSVLTLLEVTHSSSSRDSQSAGVTSTEQQQVAPERNISQRQVQDVSVASAAHAVPHRELEGFL